MSAAPLNILKMRPHKVTHTKTDTILITKEVIDGWKNPPFQRPLKVNEILRKIATSLREDGGVIPGVITLGILGRDTYVIDGQHRIAAFRMSECEEGYADVRIRQCADMSELSEEFISLNSRIVNMKPDDFLRGLEESTPSLRLIRSKCPFVGYDNIRRSDKSPILSMSTLLKTWIGAAAETPTVTSESAKSLLDRITKEEAELISDTLKLLDRAWGRSTEFAKLWNSLNLSLCFWLYRNCVLKQYSQRAVKMDKEQFVRCMMALTSDGDYVNWLFGRAARERDRSPAYARIKSIVTRRLNHESTTGKKANLPAPAWSKGHL